MSTKIYNGLRATDTNPFRVQKRVRAVIEPLFQARFTAAVAKAKENIGHEWGDVFSMGREGIEGVIPDQAYRISEKLYDLVERLRNSPVHTFSDLDFGYEVVVLPNGHGITQKPLLLVFAERGGDEYRQALIAAGVVTEYGYWDNTDKPSDLHPSEWSSRRKAWSKLNVPREDGLFIPQLSRMVAGWEAEKALRAS